MSDADRLSAELCGMHLNDYLYPLIYDIDPDLKSEAHDFSGHDITSYLHDAYVKILNLSGDETYNRGNTLGELFSLPEEKRLKIVALAKKNAEQGTKIPKRLFSVFDILMKSPEEVNQLYVDIAGAAYDPEPAPEPEYSAHKDQMDSGIEAVGGEAIEVSSASHAATISRHRRTNQTKKFDRHSMVDADSAILKRDYASGNIENILEKYGEAQRSTIQRATSEQTKGEEFSKFQPVSKAFFAEILKPLLTNTRNWKENGIRIFGEDRDKIIGAALDVTLTVLKRWKENNIYLDEKTKNVLYKEISWFSRSHGGDYIEPLNKILSSRNPTTGDVIDFSNLVERRSRF